MKHWTVLVLLGALACHKIVPQTQRPSAAEQLTKLDQQIAAGTITKRGLERRAQLAWVLENDEARAQKLLQQALQSGPLSADGLLLGCQIAWVERRYQQMQRTCLEVLERFPSHPVAEEAASYLTAMLDQTPDSDGTVVRVVRRAVSRCSPQKERFSCAGMALHGARMELTVAAQRADSEAYRRALVEVGAISNWRVCGPVASHTTDGYRRAVQKLHGGLRIVGPQSICVSRSTDEVLVYPSAYNQRGVYLLESWVNVKATGGITLLAQLPQASQLWIDAVPMVQRDPWLRAGGHFASATVEIAAGWHQVRVVSLPDSATDGVSVWLVDNAGAAAIVDSSATRQQGASGPPAKVVVGGTAVNHLEQQLDPGREPWRALRLLDTLSSEVFADGHRARQLANHLLAAFPHSGLGWLALAQAADGDPTLPPAQRDIEIRRALEAALEHWPGLLLARYRLALLDFDERPDDALKRMRQLVEQRPDYSWGQRRLHMMLEHRGYVVEAQRPLLAALKLAPGEASLALAEPYYQRRGRVEKLRWARQQRLDLEPKIASRRRADWQYDNGDLEGALTSLQELYRTAPDQPGYNRVLELSKLVEGWPGVQRRCLQRMKLFPRDLVCARWMVRRARAAGDSQLLETALGQAQFVRRGDPLWQLHRWRAAGQDVDDLVTYDSADLIDRFGASLQADPGRYSGHAFVYVLDAAARVFVEGGGSFLITHQILRVQSKDAASSLGEVRLPPGAERRILRVVKLDGRIIEPEPAHASGDTSLSGIEVGDFVESRYIQEQRLDDTDRAFSERFYFATQVPLYRSSYTLIAPQVMFDKLQLHSVDAPVPARQQKDGQVRLTYVARAVEAHRPEPFAGPAEEYLPHITVTRNVDVALYARRAARWASGKESTNQDVIDFARQQCRGLGGARAKLRALVQGVIQAVPVTGHEGNPVAVLATGRGARLPLLRAAALAAGLDARLVGVHHASPLAAVDWSDEGLSSQLLLVRIDGRDVPVYMGPQNVLVGHVLPSLRGASLVEIDPAAEHLERLGQHRAVEEGWLLAQSHQVDVHLQLDRAGTVRGNFDLLLVPPLSGFVRGKVRSAPKRNIEQGFETWFGELFPGAVFDSFAIEGTDDDLAPLRVKITFTASAFATQSGSSLVIDRYLPQLSLIIGGESASPASYLRGGRRYTALYMGPHSERARVSLSLPKGSKLKTLPATINEFSIFGRYRQISKVVDGTLTVEREIEVPYVRVAPADYPQLRKLGERVASSTSNRLVMTNATAPGDG